MSSNRSRRHQPYDLNNPLNWTVSKLKSELAKKGLNLTANITKPALLQIYQQLDTSVNVSENSGNSSQSDQQITMPPPNEDNLNTNILGVVSGVQTAVLSLQQTVNQLLQNKSSPQSSSNMLAKIYESQGTGSSPGATGTLVQQNGVGADDLPHIDVVSENLKKQIREGKYVNLACLLIPDFDAPNFTTNELSGLELVRQSRRDHRLDRVLSISQFFKAFGIYKRIMCEAFPQRRSELDLYEADIGTIFDHYGSLFYQYHVQFSRKAAAYLEKGIKVDWSKRDTNMFQLIVGGAKSKLCDHCSQTDHQSAFCPSQINVPGVSNKRSELLKGSSKTDSSVDRHGRPKVMFQGREICNNFNSRACSNKACSLLHVCKKCKSFTHGESKCESQKSAYPAPQTNKDGDKNKSKPSD